MAGDAIVGALRAVLGLDTAQFEDGVKRASKQAEGLGQGLKATGTAAIAAGNVIANAIEGIAKSIASSMSSSITKLADLGKAAQKAGADVSDFGAIASVANKVGVSTDEVATSLQRLSRSIAEVAAGKSGEASKAFEVLHINVRDVNNEVKTSTQVFAELADKFKTFSDGPQKTALAYALLGKASGDTVAILSQGSDAIKKSKQELEDLGIVITKETVDSALKARQEFDKLGRVWDSIILKLTVGMLPSIQATTTSLVDLAKDAKKMEEVQSSLNAIIAFAGTTFLSLAGNIKIVKDEITTLNAVLELVKKGNISDAFTILRDRSLDSAEGIGKLINTLNPAGALGKEVAKVIVDLSKQTLGLNTSVFDLKGSVESSNLAFTDWFGALAKIGVVTPTAVSATTELSTAFDGIIKLSNEISNIKVTPPTLPLGDLTKAIADLNLKSRELRGEFLNLAPGFAQQALGLGLIKTQADFARISLGNLTADEKALNNALKEFTAAQQGKAVTDSLLSMNIQVRELTGGLNAVTPGFAAQAQSLGLIKTQADLARIAMGDLTANEIKLNDAINVVNATRLSQEFLSPWEQFQLRLQEINRLLGTEHPISAEIAAAASMKAAAQMATSYGEAAAAITTPMASAFKTLAEMNTKYAAAAKAAAIAEALVNTYLGATKAFTALAAYPPLAFAAAAAATAAGLANVAKIAATPFAQGGSFKVGGTGGIDSQLITMKATPGEMVDVRRPGTEKSTSSDITVRGMAPDDIFTGSWLRSFVEALNQGDRDGYKLRFAER